MVSLNEISPSAQVPLVVDLDGTLIRTDLLWEYLGRLVRRNPCWIFPILFWWLRGRAFLKQQLARRVQLDPLALPYHKDFMRWLRAQKAGGRTIILATASDYHMAKPVADCVGLFDEVLASDGKTNLRRGNKLKALIAKYGERGFDYAGNSPDDLAVWSGAREAIVVNASRKVRAQAATITRIAETFPENYSRFINLQCFVNEVFVHSGYAIAAGAGLLLATAFPKHGLAGLAWLAPALMLLAASGKSRADAFRAGYVAGFAFWLASLYWLLLIPVTGYPILGWLALAAFLALFMGIWTWFTAPGPGRTANLGSWAGRTGWALAGAAAWVALEMFRARIFSGFPWSFLAASQYQLTPLIQISAITGVYGVSFVVVWASLSLFSAVRMIFQKPTTRLAWQAEIILPLLAVITLFIIGAGQLRQPATSGKSVRITLAQPSVPQTMIWDRRENANRFAGLLELSANALTNRTDLLIWPEAGVPEFDDVSYQAITNFAGGHHVSMIFNADEAVWADQPRNDKDFVVYNSAFLLQPDGHLASIYRKQNLVVFGEYIPLVKWLPFIKWFTPIEDGFAAGDHPGLFRIPALGINAVPLICFEDTFPHFVRLAVNTNTDFLVNLTNDGWFGTGDEQWQHAANAVFRAVENGVPLVRCCNNGLTCWIDAHGRIRQLFKDRTGSEYGPGAMSFELPLPLEKASPTFYNRHGDWFGWGCVAVTVLFAGRMIWRSKMNREGKN